MKDGGQELYKTATIVMKRRRKKERNIIYGKVRRALERGILVRGKQCEICGTKDSPCKDGRSRIHSHHEDYSKPLIIKWLCAYCHKKTSPFDPDFHPRSKLNRVKVEAIKDLKSRCGWKQTDIARLFMVNLNTISKVISKKSWLIKEGDIWEIMTTGK